MDAQKLVMGIVGLAVIIMVTTAVILPAVSNAEETQITEMNNTSAAYFVADTNESLTLSYSDSKLYVNSVDYTSLLTEAAQNRVLLSDNLSVSVSSSGFVFADYTTASTAVSGVSDIVIANNAYTYTKNGVETTGTVMGTVYCIGEKGTYGAYYRDYGGAFTADKNSVLILQFTVNVSNSDSSSTFSLRGIAKGAPNNLVVMYAVDGTNNQLVDASKVSVNIPDLVETDDDVGYVVTPNRVAATYTAELDTYTGTTTGTVIFAPIEYHTITDEDAQIRALFGIIPILVIIAAVLYAVRLMGTSRN